MTDVQVLFLGRLYLLPTAAPGACHASQSPGLSLLAGGSLHVLMTGTANAEDAHWHVGASVFAPCPSPALKLSPNHDGEGRRWPCYHFPTLWVGIHQLSVAPFLEGFKCFTQIKTSGSLLQFSIGQEAEIERGWLMAPFLLSLSPTVTG